MQRKLRITHLLAVVVLLAATHTCAMWPFGSSEKEEKTQKLVADGNATLASGDEAWRNEKGPLATERYQAAIEIYTQAETLVPNLENGRVRYRIAYCRGQIAQIEDTAKKKQKEDTEVKITHPTSGSGAESGTDQIPSGATMDSAEMQRELRSAQQLITGNHPDEAVPSIIKVLKAEPNNRLALMLMTAARMKQGRYDAAVITIETLRDTPQEDAAVLLLAAGAYCGTKPPRYFDALLALDKVLKANPKMPEAHLDMAWLLVEMAPDKQEDARKYYDYAIKLGAPRDTVLEKRLGLKTP
jgi:tetratricopeptide (TPR) repeat protein